MKRLVAVLVVAMLVLGLAGCGGIGGGGKTIKIGIIGPLTGDAKTFGESTRDGALLALEQAGMKAGDWTIEYVIGDDRGDSTEGVNVATKMITQDKVKAIVGTVMSGVSIPISEIANSNKVVMISPTSTSPKVTVGEAGRKPYIFRACFIDPFQGTVGAKFALETLKAKKAAVLYDKGNDYTVGLAEFFKAAFEAGGGQVVSFDTYAKDDTDFSAVLTNVAAKNPDVVFLPDYYQKVSLIGKQARERGITAPFVGGDGWDSGDLDYATMAGGFFTNHYSAEDPRPEVQNFVKAYGEMYKDSEGKAKVPDALATLGYDATIILLEAIKQANSDDPDKIRDAMANMKDFKAVSGGISFDENGNPVKAAVILQVQADKSFTYQTTVQP